MNPEQTLEILDVVFYILTATGGAAWLSAIPQVQKVVKFLPVASKLLNFVAGNIGGAKNKD